MSDAVGDVRFRVDHADDKDLAMLTECLNRQPGVEGVGRSGPHRLAVAVYADGLGYMLPGMPAA